MSETDPVTKVARNLSAIEDLATHLEAEAIHRANDRLMPGGLAMVALAPVANQEARWWMLDAAENAGIFPELDDEEESGPVLQTLCFWSEAWRTEHGMESDLRPTISSEVAFLRRILNWIWENEPHFEDFARDVKDAKNRLEDLLRHGSRPAFRGVPCMYDECGGVRLIRTTVPARAKDGSKTWRLTDWHCPRCKRSWDEESYTRNVYAAIARTKIDFIDDDLWCTVDHAARRVGRPSATVRTWVHRGEVAAVCLLDGRGTFVRYDDVQERHDLASRRAADRRAAIAAKRVGQGVA